MNKNYIITAIVIIVVVLAGAYVIYGSKPDTNSNIDNSPTFNNLAQGEVKEFSMDSFYEMADGKPKPQYSLKEITVNKGDTVKIVITVTKGVHDFNIDEYNIHAKTPLNQPTAVELTADKAGEFIYYCSMPGHRAAGHWGTLKVTE